MFPSLLVVGAVCILAAFVLRGFGKAAHAAAEDKNAELATAERPYCIAATVTAIVGISALIALLVVGIGRLP